MRLVSVRELKAKPSEFLRLAVQGELVIIATRGKPTAVLRAIAEEELEDYILENSPRIRRLVSEGRVREAHPVGAGGLGQTVEVPAGNAPR